MKTTLRILIIAIVLASTAVLGVNRGAWARTMSVSGTVPNCANEMTGRIGETLTLCSTAITVNWASGTEVLVTSTDLASYGMVPGALNFGPGATISVDGQTGIGGVEVCFSDPTGVGLIYRWMSESDWQTYYNTVESGKWLLSPTYHKTGGLTCTQSWLLGTFTIVY
jgi:hypothetical protein